MGLIEELYTEERREAETIWEKSDFHAFSPELPLLKGFRRAFASGDNGFFINGLRNGYFAQDKSDQEIASGQVHAMNRGVTTLNRLCKQYLPGQYPFLEIPEIKMPKFDVERMKSGKEQLPFDFFEFLSGAMEKREKAISGLHPGSQGETRLKGQRLKDYLSAFNAQRAWGLGNLVLKIDEFPSFYHSVRYRNSLVKWFREVFNFNNPAPSYPAQWYAWQNNSGIPVYGTAQMPFRERTKILDENGEPKYGPVLIKMFRKADFADSVYDTSGIEIIVATEADVKKMVTYFRDRVRGKDVLEKFQHVSKPTDGFYADKFILRVPIRVEGHKPKDSDRGEPDKMRTTLHPLDRMIRLPVEVQIRALDQIDPSAHERYERERYFDFFPLAYPRHIFIPVLQGKLTEKD